MLILSGMCESEIDANGWFVDEIPLLKTDILAKFIMKRPKVSLVGQISHDRRQV
jgi:hypothetical protein